MRHHETHPPYLTSQRYIKFFLDFYGHEEGFIECIGGQYSAFFQKAPEPEDGQEFVVDSSQHKYFLILKKSNAQKNPYELKEMSFLNGQEIIKSERDLKLSITDEKDVYWLQTAERQYSDDHWQIECSNRGDVLAKKIVGGDCVERHY